MKIEMFLDKQGCWRWHIKAKNRLILASSEAYSDKDACKDTAIMLADATGLTLIEIPRNRKGK